MLVESCRPTSSASPAVCATRDPRRRSTQPASTAACCLPPTPCYLHLHRALLHRCVLPSPTPTRCGSGGRPAPATPPAVTTAGPCIARQRRGRARPAPTREPSRRPRSRQRWRSVRAARLLPARWRGRFPSPPQWRRRSQSGSGCLRLPPARMRDKQAMPRRRRPGPARCQRWPAPPTPCRGCRRARWTLLRARGSFPGCLPARPCLRRLPGRAAGNFKLRR